MSVTLAEMNTDDWPHVRNIYIQGIATGMATFAEAAPDTWEEWDANHSPKCRMVARDEENILGWAALSLVSKRPVYAGVAEVSIYLAEQARGGGIGKVLLEALIAASEAQGIWTLQSGIFPENEASVRLHQRLGFREVGRRERIGKMTYGPFARRWRDVLLLERRSRRIGMEQ